VEVVGSTNFRAGEDGGGRSTGAGRARRPIFLSAGDESWLRGRLRGCQVFIAGKGPEKEVNRWVALSGIISYLTAKCGCNVHNRGVVEITASTVIAQISQPFVKAA
jgi:hypothetical protein